MPTLRRQGLEDAQGGSWRGRRTPLQRRGNCHFLQRTLPRAAQSRHAPARPLAVGAHPPVGAAWPPPPDRGRSGGRRPREESGERAEGPWRRCRPAVPGRWFPGTAAPGDRLRGPRGRPVRPAAASGRWRRGPTPREAAPRPVILWPSNPAGRGPRHPPARGGSRPDGGVAKAAEPGRHTCTFLRPAVFCR